MSLTPEQYKLREGKLESYRSSIIDAAETLVKCGPREDWWYAADAIRVLESTGAAIEEKFHAGWLGRLRAYDAQPRAPMGESLSGDLEYGAPERWAEENT